VRDDGVVLVLDFGVALSESDGAPITLTGDLVGTPAYMAPEQLATSHGTLDRRVDVWALGVTLYEALVGERPFKAPTREDEVRRALRDDPFPLPRAAHRELPRRDLETVLATALAKEPQHRYASAVALADDLARLRGGEAPLARRPGAMLRAARWARRRPGLATALGALVVFALATAWLLGQSRTQLRDIRRLADLETAQRLIAARATLFPLTPETASRGQAWLDGAAEVLARRSLHEAQLAEVPETDAHGWSDRGDAASQWHRAQLVALLARFDELGTHSARLMPRVAVARDLARITLVERAADWRPPPSACDATRASPLTRTSSSRRNSASCRSGPTPRRASRSSRTSNPGACRGARQRPARWSSRRACASCWCSSPSARRPSE